MKNECVKFKKDITIEAGKDYMIFYDVKNKVADIKEVVGYAGNQPIFKNGELWNVNGSIILLV